MAEAVRIRTFVAAALLAAVPSLLPAAGATGSNESAAKTVSIGSATPVSLTYEYYPDDKEYDYESAVYYFKFTAKRSNAYTVYLDNIRGESISFSVYAKEGTETQDPPMADFEDIAVGSQSRAVMYADSWYIDDEDPEYSDPKEWIFYVYVSAESLLESATLHVVSGVQIPAGIPDNPARITPTTTRNQLSGSYFDGEYYVLASLKADTRYNFGIAGTAPSNHISFTGIPSIKPLDLWTTNTLRCSEAFTVKPTEADDYDLMLWQAQDLESNFTLYYEQVPSRPITAHTSTALTVGGQTAPFAPGHKNTPGSGYYDEIIDEQLFRFTAIAGQSYVAWTEGSQTDLIMMVYDRNGNRLKTNEGGIGDGDLNALLGFTATSSGTYYVGVCEDIDDDAGEPPSGRTVVLNLKAVTPETGDPEPLSALPTTPGTAPESVDTVGTAPFSFGKETWTKTFMIAGRSGVTYSLNCTYATGGETDRTLAARVFTRSGTTETEVTSGVSGSLDPDESGSLTIARSAHGTFYVQVSVKDGVGQDYPPVKLHAAAYSSTAGEVLGMLTVNTKGTKAGTWSLDKENIWYAGGASVLLSGSGDPSAPKTYQLKFSAVADYSQPTNQIVKMVGGPVPVVHKGVYSDLFDPKDDELTGTGHGPTAWPQKRTVTSLSRTLWIEDPRDWFSFSAADGQYYSFSFTSNDGADEDGKTIPGAGDAVITICDANGTPVSGAVEKSAISRFPLQKGNYTLKVAHPGPDAGMWCDTTYCIEGHYDSVGAVRFAKTAYSVRENAAVVTLVVNRTGKDGSLRVRYSTADGTVEAGEAYYAQEGVLSWADGESDAKRIEIRLIPELVGIRQGGKRTFQVHLEDAGQADYPAMFPTGFDTATVTITDVAAPDITSVEKAYAHYTPVKKRTVTTEQVPLRTGYFRGVLKATDAVDPDVPRRSYAALSVSSVSRSGRDSISAKATLSGRSVSFATGALETEPWSDLDGGRLKAVLENGDDRLELIVADGASAADWATGGGTAVLTLDGVSYEGAVYRDSSKVQDFLDEVVNFTGYYTVALESQTDGSAVEPGDTPAGHPYLAVTVDNAGRAKVSGRLADGTGISLSSSASYLKEEDSSANGYDLFVPVFTANGYNCLGGTLVFRAIDRTNGDGRKTVVVSTSDSTLEWICDNKALSYAKDKGFRYREVPVGGFFDTVERLQRHYYDLDLETFAVKTVSVDELPDAIYNIGGLECVERVATGQANGFSVDLAVDKFATARRILVRDSSRRYDFAASQNPANVNVRMVRATGLVSGSFSLWATGTSKGETVQRQITGPRHYGIVILNSDPDLDLCDDLDDLTVSAGFFVQSVSVPTEVQNLVRRWKYSAPFDIRACEK